jgi:hypothetical protein
LGDVALSDSARFVVFCVLPVPQPSRKTTAKTGQRPATIVMGVFPQVTVKTDSYKLTPPGGLP